MDKRVRRSLLAAAAAALAAAAAPGALAQDRPVELVIPLPPGGAMDSLGRAFAQALTEVSGRSHVVVNKAGAGGGIGMAAVSMARPDGATLGMAPSNTVTVFPHPDAKRNVPYKLDSFDYLCQTFENHFAVVTRPDSPIDSPKALVERARANPGKLSFGMAGTGTIPHFAMAQLQQATGTQMVGVPYPGDAQSILEVLAGRLDFATVALASVGSQPVRIIGMFSDARQKAHPAVPTFAEQGIPVVQVSFGGVYVPRGLPRPQLDQLAATCAQAANHNTYRSVALRLDQPDNYFRPAAEFRSRIEADSADKAKLLPTMNLTPQ